MTSILVIDSNRRNQDSVKALVLSLVPDAEVSTGYDLVDAEEYLADEGAPFDVFLIQGAMQDGKSAGQIDTTLTFLRKLHELSADADPKVIVLSDSFDEEPYVSRYQAAFPGCRVLRRTAVLNGGIPLDV